MKATDGTIPKLMTGKEVAELLSLSPRTIADWGAAGEIPSVVLGDGPKARRRYDPVVIARWLKSRAEGVGAR
jgi:excisionase family DNA binding protein